MRRRDVLRAGAATLSPVGVGSATAGRTGAADDGFEPLGRLALPGAKDLVVDDGVAYVATTDGFATVDITDPAAPELLAERRNLLPDHPD
ncbi:hypothetical protein BRC99_05500 [Halobacteriales archaeon QS_7_69_60]|nr:MAG: hypothetical protein BRC99_05500 [Halobacteriales archaeon QS_7_69_60]